MALLCKMSDNSLLLVMQCTVTPRFIAVAVLFPVTYDDTSEAMHKVPGDRSAIPLVGLLSHVKN